MKAKDARAGGRHVAAERGAFDKDRSAWIARSGRGPRGARAPMHTFLNQRSLDALAALFPKLMEDFAPAA